MCNDNKLISGSALELKAKILEAIIAKSFVSFNGAYFSSVEIKKMFIALYVAGIYSDKEIKEKIHERLIVLGCDMYKGLSRFNPPDHCESPEALGYAIKHGAISEKDVADIPFDHNETVQDYLKMAEGFLDFVFRNLTVPVVEKDLGHTLTDLDYISCGDGGPCACC